MGRLALSPLPDPARLLITHGAVQKGSCTAHAGTVREGSADRVALVCSWPPDAAVRLHACLVGNRLEAVLVEPTFTVEINGTAAVIPEMNAFLGMVASVFEESAGVWCGCFPRAMLRQVRQASLDPRSILWSEPKAHLFPSASFQRHLSQTLQIGRH
jgi:hypothetical protein